MFGGSLKDWMSKCKNESKTRKKSQFFNSDVPQMKTLVIGHGSFYLPKKQYKTRYRMKRGKNYLDIRCSPLPVEDWYHEEFISVDIDPNVKPDIVYELCFRDLGRFAGSRIVRSSDRYIRWQYSVPAECTVHGSLKRFAVF
jgi:hypothetical protein